VITITSVEAQNRFGQLLDTVQRETVIVTRHGRPAAYIISSEAYKTLSGANREDSENSDAYLHSIQSFRGKGIGGATLRQLADRKVDDGKGV
jgi:prevent-host-death family protein